jgi:8-oxo-dGTP pyrophosphatase MutT (NUDIX family)
VTGDGWTRCGLGHAHWGRFGAAGLLAYARDGDGQVRVLLQRRSRWTDHGGTWGLLGGARREGEPAVGAALREACEESTLDPGAPRITWREIVDHGGWSYTTVAAALPERNPVEGVGRETSAVAWVDVAGVGSLHLHPGFAASWPALRRRLEAG